ncbi:MAG TPA: methyltransferase domain-containing protein, partial [Armatimonadota bacterium]|nr:methyltransferase domain-containing protein [Armatimonadota bacterium]
MADDWWRSFFDDWYLDNWVGAAASAQVTAEQVDFIVQTLQLAPGARVLDACCGEGRHCRELARRGFDVVGVDQSAASLVRGQAQEPVVRYVHQDVREMRFDAEFDAAINMFTAFGYMDEA